MATVTVRNLTPKVVRSLKSLAKRNGRSMEQEVREIINDFLNNENLDDRFENLSEYDLRTKRNLAIGKA